jgi:hypothetical protein
MDAEENQHQVSLGATPRLEIAARFPHFHRLDHAEENWKANRRLPTFPQHGLLSLFPKEGPDGGSLRLRRPGSSLNEKMLSGGLVAMR